MKIKVTTPFPRNKTDLSKGDKNKLLVKKFWKEKSIGFGMGEGAPRCDTNIHSYNTSPNFKILNPPPLWKISRSAYKLFINGCFLKILKGAWPQIQVKFHVF
jgi:hypothetical protein